MPVCIWFQDENHEDTWHTLDTAVMFRHIKHSFIWWYLKRTTGCLQKRGSVGAGYNLMELICFSNKYLDVITQKYDDSSKGSPICDILSKQEILYMTGRQRNIVGIMQHLRHGCSHTHRSSHTHTGMVISLMLSTWCNYWWHWCNYW